MRSRKTTFDTAARDQRDRRGARRQGCRSRQELPRARARTRHSLFRRSWRKKWRLRSRRRIRPRRSRKASHADSSLGSRRTWSACPEPWPAISSCSATSAMRCGRARGWPAGEKADELVLGLACVGLAVTAGTYATLGAGTPARVGLSVVKAARKTGRLGARMATWIGRSVREVVDWSSLRRDDRRRLARRACGRDPRGPSGGQGREGGRPAQCREGRGPGAVQGRHQGCARRPQDRRGTARRRAGREACRGPRAARRGRSSRRSAAAPSR